MKGVIEVINVLFVCLGNICRSPMAEAVCRHMINAENLASYISVDSAGTAGWHTNKPPHAGTRGLLDKMEISYTGQKARPLNKVDFTHFNYMIAMDAQNIADIKEGSTNNDNPIIAKLTDFINEPQESDVPDPYYTGDFDYTYKLVSAGCEGLLNHIRKQHNI